MGTGRTRFVLRPPVDDAPVPHRRAHLRERAYVLRGVTVEHDDVGREPRREASRRRAPEAGGWGRGQHCEDLRRGEPGPLQVHELLGGVVIGHVTDVGPEEELPTQLREGARLRHSIAEDELETPSTRRDCVRGPGRQREALAPGPLNSCLVGASTRPGAGSSLLPVSASVWSNAAVEAVPETIEALTAASSRAAWDASLRCRY